MRLDINPKEMTQEEALNKINELRNEANAIEEELLKHMDKAQIELFDIAQTIRFILTRGEWFEATKPLSAVIITEQAERIKAKSQAINGTKSMIHFIQ